MHNLLSPLNLFQIFNYNYVALFWIMQLFIVFFVLKESGCPP